MRLATLACAAAALFAASSARAQTETGRLNVHLNLALAGTPSGALGLVGNAGFDWQFVAPVALDVDFSAGGLGLLAGSGSDPVIFAATAGVRFRFLDTARADGYIVPRAGYLLDRNDNSSYATAHLEAGAEFTVDGPVRLGPYVQIAGSSATRSPDIRPG